MAGTAYTSFPPGQAANCTVAVAVGQESTRPICGVAAALRSATVFGSPLSSWAAVTEEESSLELSLHAASVASSPHSATHAKIRPAVTWGPCRCRRYYASRAGAMP
jgi:hypothetical protein